MSNSYRILSIEACDIYKQEQENGQTVGFKLPSERNDEYFGLFLNKLDRSLDSIELKRVYGKICGEPFSFCDKYGNGYTLAVINVKFDLSYKIGNGDEKKVIANKKELRETLYDEGFCVDGVHYVRYKRSAGSSRQGKCFFIDERLYAAMASWGECGLSPTNDLASWESYKALSLSSIKDTVDIPIESILFVPDYKSKFIDEAVSVELSDGEIVAETKATEITNDIWDGESLLDESAFAGNFGDKHMLLLRNKFFKSCAFRTKLKKWIADNDITLDDLKHRGFVTLATDISQIVMVTTPNSLKYLKFAGGLSEENIRRWADCVDSVFGVVKWDKRTKFFNGRMVLSSYQLLNTIGLTAEQSENFLRDSTEYLTTIRKDIDFMRYHFSDVCAKEKDDSEDDDEEKEMSDGLVDRAEVIFRLMQVNSDLQYTKLYTDFRNEMVKNQKYRLREGRVLISGTNATLFGNGPELLKYMAGEKIESVLKPGQIRCGKFGNGQKLLCARSPHITMGNLYCVENNLDGEIWDYFDLGENIVCVNAIGENIQQRLNGCDYDSDTMLITDDDMLIQTAEKYAALFKVPVCKIESSGAAHFTLAELDHNTSENKIGDIVNLSQKLNSLIWDKLNKGDSDIADIYSDVCKLAVLSGLEIDKAKRAYDDVRVGNELASIRKKNQFHSPSFFKVFDKKRDEKYDSKKGKKDEQEKRKKPKEYTDYHTAMEYIYKTADKIDFRKGKPKIVKYIRISDMLDVEPVIREKDRLARDVIIELCNSYNWNIMRLREKIRKTDADERDVIYECIGDLKTERDKVISELITNESILYSVLSYYETGNVSDWNLYAPILNSAMFSRILKRSRVKLATVSENPFGKFYLYKFRYSKV